MKRSEALTRLKSLQQAASDAQAELRNRNGLRHLSSQEFFDQEVDLIPAELPNGGFEFTIKYKEPTCSQ